jgi:hypothetical protein
LTPSPPPPSPLSCKNKNYHFTYLLDHVVPNVPTPSLITLGVRHFLWMFRKLYNWQSFDSTRCTFSKYFHYLNRSLCQSHLMPFVYLILSLDLIRGYIFFGFSSQLAFSQQFTFYWICTRSTLVQQWITSDQELFWPGFKTSVPSVSPQ